MRRVVIISIGIAIMLTAGLFFVRHFFVNSIPAQGLPRISDIANDNDSSFEEIPDTEVIGENFTIPWDIVFIDGSLIVTERTGRLVLFDPRSGTQKSIPVPGVQHTGEGGLLGAALHPNFNENRYLYLYFSTAYAGGTRNTVSRFVYQGGMLSNERTILENIPGAPYHDGGRMAFGPDGMLYITTGDATEPENAQDRSSLAGKILRVHDDGSIPAENPFGTAVYSYGHRNPQGVVWDDAGRLWSTEHGRSGIRSGLDELNLIRPGANYGWPESEGDTVRPGTVGPVVHSGPDVTWAPAGAVYWDGSIFFPGLRGETLYEAVLDGTRVREVREHVSGVFGRLRTIVLGPDGFFYITTSNRDGRGTVRTGDDKIIRLRPQQFR